MSGELFANGRTYGRLVLASTVQGRHLWIIQAQPDVLLRLRRLFPRVENRAGDIAIRNTPEVCADLRWALQRWPLDMDPMARAYLHEHAEDFTERVASFGDVLDGRIAARPLATALPLREYQASAVELALRSGGLLVGDELGTGKTAIGIGVISEVRPAVVVTMTALPRQWERELKRFVPGIRTCIPSKGTAYDLVALRGGRSKPWRLPETDEEHARFPDVVILNYAKLAGWADALRTVARCVVFDEAHELRVPGSHKHQAAERLAEACEIRVGLTATPVFNYGGDMHSILRVIAPDALGSRDEFRREWCGEEDVVKHPAAFGTHLRTAGVYIRRTRADIGRELPPLTLIPVVVETDPEPLKEAQSEAAALAKRILGRLGERGELFRAAGELDWRLRQATGIAKAPHVAAFVQMLVEQGEQVLLAGWHHAVYDLWSQAFAAAKVRCVRFTGDETPTQKLDAFERFREGKADVMMMSLRAGAGLDGLQGGRCSVVVIGELDWSPRMHHQLIGRLHRDGQTKNVLAYFCISEWGSDPVIVDVLGLKQMQAKGIEDPEGTDLAPVTDTDRVRRMAEAYLRSIGEVVPEAQTALITESVSSEASATP